MQITQGRSQDLWQGERYLERSNSATCFTSWTARSAANQTTAGCSQGAQPHSGIWGKLRWEVRGSKPPENFQGVMLILDPESTCKRHFNKTSNSHLGCKNEQQAHYEVKLQNIITDT